MRATPPQLTIVAAPAPLTRTKFDQWLVDRGLTNAAAAERLACAGETVRRYRLPFGETDRRIPDESMLRAIHGLTAGEVRAADFYPEDIR